MKKRKFLLFLSGAFLFVGTCLFQFFRGPLHFPPAGDVQPIVARNTAALNAIEQTVSLEEVEPDIVFQREGATSWATLSVSSASRYEVLKIISQDLHMQLSINSHDQAMLEQKISLNIKNSIDMILQNLLLDISFFIMKNSEKGDENAVWLCVGKNACAANSFVVTAEDATRPVLNDGENLNSFANADFAPAPSEAFLNAMNANVQPGGDSSLEEQSRILKSEYAYADTHTKIQIIKELDVNTQDVEFVIEALLFEQDAAVRQTAARQLYLPDNMLAMNALLETLNDPDELLVMTVLNVLNHSTDEDLRYQVSSLMADHPSTAIKHTLDLLGFN